MEQTVSFRQVQGTCCSVCDIWEGNDVIRRVAWDRRLVFINQSTEETEAVPATFPTTCFPVYVLTSLVRHGSKKLAAYFLVLCGFSCVHPHVVGYLSPTLDFVAKNVFTYHYWQQDRLVMSFLRGWHTAFALFSSGICMNCPVCTFGCTEPRTWHKWVTNVSVTNACQWTTC